MVPVSAHEVPPLFWLLPSVVGSQTCSAPCGKVLFPSFPFIQTLGEITCPSRAFGKVRLVSSNHRARQRLRAGGIRVQPAPALEESVRV